MSKWISQEELARLYETKIDIVQVFVFNNKDKIFIKNSMVDVEYLEAKINEVIRLTNIAHEYFYYLLGTLHISEHRLAKTIEIDIPNIAWAKYLANDLFKRVDNISITNIFIPHTRLIRFVEWCEYNIPRIRRSNGKI